MLSVMNSECILRGVAALKNGRSVNNASRYTMGMHAVAKYAFRAFWIIGRFLENIPTIRPTKPMSLNRRNVILNITSSLPLGKYSGGLWGG